MTPTEISPENARVLAFGMQFQREDAVALLLVPGATPEQLQRARLNSLVDDFCGATDAKGF